MSERPNILLITTDQHRYDAAGFMGHPDVKTPNLDRLAEGGVIFERTYVTNPVCTPSRATWLTGQFPDAHGVRRNGMVVPDPPWGMARVLHRHGWRTGIFGKTHFAPLRRDFQEDYQYPGWHAGADYYGFEERAITHDLKDYVSERALHYRASPKTDPARAYNVDDYLTWIEQHRPDLYALAIREGLPEEEGTIAPELWTSEIPVEHHQSTWIADQTIDFIERHRHEPFFAWCSFVDPHHPFNAPRLFREQYDAAVLAEPVWSDDELQRRSRYHRTRHDRSRDVWRRHWREYRAQYYGMISQIDVQVDRLIRSLETLGQAERTLVIFTSDHGEMLGDHGLNRKGFFHYEPLIRVPLLFYWPGQLPAGLRQPGIVQSVDLPATILDVANLPVPQPYQGISLQPWCRGERRDPPRSHALVTNGTPGPDHDPSSELRTLVTDRWKLHYYVGEGHLEIDDLAGDPLELNPVGVEQQPDLAQELLMKLIDASSAASMWQPHIGRW